MKLLELQRASAGSGKTYSLAKKFLWYFLTIPVRKDDDTAGPDMMDVDDEEVQNPTAAGVPRRLRTDAEIRDSLSHILAVTFTNKATNEMQQRIVEKLFVLAYPDLRPDKSKAPDYQDEFRAALGVPVAKLTHAARVGLWALLENYSDFHVSTIDSFFQQVLRTFAYETDLNDSFGLELDSDMLSAVSVNATFEDIDTGDSSDEVKFWLNLIMNDGRARGGTSWNIFQSGDKEVGKGFKNAASPYEGIINALKQLDSEEFKQLRDEIEKYFTPDPENPRPRFSEIFRHIDHHYRQKLKEPYDRMMAAARRLKSVDKERDLSVLHRYLSGHIRKALLSRVDRKPGSTDSFAVLKDKVFDDARKKGGIAADLAALVGDDYVEMREAREEWLAILDSAEYMQWKVYRDNMPYMGLLSEVMNKRREWLQNNNAVELAETNTLLVKITENDDAPFIYERLGTQLDHFLIDEFQDTSKLQWVNLKPLLRESLSRGMENLLIGDPKQSIYRFRNADPSLITHAVQAQLAGVFTSGSAPDQNTNWRSDRNVVQFNNDLFTFLADRLTNPATVAAGGLDFRDLYSNVAQNIKREEETGYVEIYFLPPKSSPRKKKGAEAEIEVAQPTGPDELQWTRDRVLELLNRGYAMGDIAILVNKGSEGEAIVASFTEYNAMASDGMPKLEFVSEQSLKVGSALSVQIILNLLETIGKGVNPVVRTGEERDRRGVADWGDVSANYRLFAMRNPNMNPAEALDAMLGGAGDMNAVEGMLAEMQAVTLPALVEGIAATFLTPEMRHNDAPFIAAFQDYVLEFCESHSADIPSFLTWWKKAGIKKSISSPEGMNAINIMTIHKSKGLEFPCVIMPYSTYEFNTSGNGLEWRWVKPQNVFTGGYQLPPYLPVAMTEDVLGTTHAPLYNRYIDMVTMDTLNKLYVGFTRAKNELYVYTKMQKSGADYGFGELLKKHLEVGAETEAHYGHKYEVAPTLIERQKAAEAKKKEQEKQKEKDEKDEKNEKEDAADTSKAVTMTLPEYTARITPDFLKYKKEGEEAEDGATDGATDGAEDEAEIGVAHPREEDPRSEGNLLHAAMERVVVAADVPKAFERLYRRGKIDRRRMLELQEELIGYLDDPDIKERGWFSGDWQVLNERSLIEESRGALCRPDRIMISPEGDAVVVDYKFGDHINVKAYYLQMSEYLRILRETGRYRTVRGYIWYVRRRHIESVWR